MFSAVRNETWRGAIPLVLGAVIAFAALQFARSYFLGNPEEAALGRETEAALHAVGDGNVACADPRDSQQCVDAYESKGRPPSILFLGNSQLYGINRFQPGDRTTPTLLHEKLQPRGYYLVAYAEPNANLFEQGLVFAALAPVYNPKLLILPIFLDKMREQGVRTEIAEFLNDPLARKSVMASPLWPMIRSLVNEPHRETEAAPHEENKVFHQRFEKKVNAALSSISGVWADRANVGYVLKIGLGFVRNMVLGINSRSKRKVERTVYLEKMRALEAILQDAQARNVKVLVYLPPYRQDMDGPIVGEDYALLKRDLAVLVQKYGTGFADLDNIVPGPEWGTIVDTLFGTSQFDFVHFTAAGHRRHADALDNVLRQMGY